MPITSAAWADLLEPTVHHTWDAGLRTVPSMLEMFYTVRASSKAYETVARIDGMSDDAWGNYELTGQVSEVSPAMLPGVTYTHGEFVQEIKIQRKFVDDNMMSQALQPVTRVSISAGRKRERDAASIFNNAFSTGAYAGPDGYALCSASHSVSNITVSALSKSAVDAGIEAMAGFIDGAGNPMPAYADTLLVPTALRQEALVIAGSQLDPTSANNAINSAAGLRVVVWPYLTSSTKWFLIDSTQAKMANDWFNRAMPTVTRKVQDETLWTTYIAYMRYSRGFNDWRWVYGSNAS